jgi:hypothetical protein
VHNKLKSPVCFLQEVYIEPLISRTCKSLVSHGLRHKLHKDPKMKKTISTICVFLLVIVLAVGCAAPPAAPAAPTTGPQAAEEPAPAAPAAPAQSSVTLSYLVSQGWAPDAEMELAKSLKSKPA